MPVARDNPKKMQFFSYSKRSIWQDHGGEWHISAPKQGFSTLARNADAPEISVRKKKTWFFYVRKTTLSDSLDSAFAADARFHPINID